MSGVFPREIFGHWIQDEDTAAPKDPAPAKSNVDLRNLLNEPGALRELVKFINTVKDDASDKPKKRANPKHMNKHQRKN